MLLNAGADKNAEDEVRKGGGLTPTGFVVCGGSSSWTVRKVNWVVIVCSRGCVLSLVWFAVCDRLGSAGRSVTTTCFNPQAGQLRFPRSMQSGVETERCLGLTRGSRASGRKHGAAQRCRLRSGGGRAHASRGGRGRQREEQGEGGTCRRGKSLDAQRVGRCSCVEVAAVEGLCVDVGLRCVIGHLARWGE